MTFLRLPVLVAALLLVSACASTDRTFGAAPEYEVAELSSLPEPTARQIYRLGPQEVVDISVVGAEALSGTYLTTAEGNLDYPLLGTVPVAGLSPSEAGRLIADGLRGDYVRNPQVRVIPKELPKNSISVGGEVERPGTYPVNGDTSTLMRAINDAGGLGDYARHDDVLIMRNLDGQRYIGVYNISAIQRGNYGDPVLYADDIVMVGDSPGRRRIERLVGVLAPFISTTAVILNQITR